ncbi:hypothetical protein EXS74_01060 [Candidatus Woesearchaeota archaeon]|nr:hypothetical protein [Candidatus Woesearchaeota archaeon]
MDWGLDFLSATTKYPNGFTQPKVTLGYFDNSGVGVLQRMFFDELLGFSFYRTPWQLVFPGQTAGLVRKAGVSIEHHVRFYNDGIIDLEEEHGRFRFSHYTGKREHRKDVLEGLLQASVIGRTWGDRIQPLFGEKRYNESL